MGLPLHWDDRDSAEPHSFSFDCGVFTSCFWSMQLEKGMQEKGIFGASSRGIWCGLDAGLCAWFLAPFLEAFQIREWTNIAFMMKPVDNNVIEVGRIFGGFEGGHSKSLGMALALGTILSFYCIFSENMA